jgi:hypothetical protein
MTPDDDNDGGSGVDDGDDDGDEGCNDGDGFFEHSTRKVAV